MRKSPIKSALLTDTLKFTMFSRHFRNAIGIPDSVKAQPLGFKILKSSKFICFMVGFSFPQKVYK